ncbi:hypothetical protein PVL29_022794 [Vitis rotundifolia]|uniref:Uncharacterized protein n=1 Tax=Vitis rotundifolia TaxID=103349 RepID=A0AA38YWW1_VITRO|nr:hypothetical protein PVL29_022794 [Vitis rotundifolia]
MESGLYSPRTDAFPSGLRVLAVDDDPAWIKILEKNALRSVLMTKLFIGFSISLSDLSLNMKNKRHDDQKSVDPLGSKKGRMVWSLDLHQKFVDATIQIGFDKARPKKILDLMNVPRELLKENEVKTSQGMKQQDFTRPGSFGFQTSTLYTGNNTLLIDMSTRICREADKKATASILSMDLKETSASNFLDRQRQVQSNTTTQTRNEVLMEQFKQPPDQDPDLCALLDDDFSHALQSASQHLLQVDLQYSAYAVGLETSVPERDESGCVMITPLCSQSRIGMKNQVVNLNCLNDWEPTQQKVFAVGDSSLGSQSELLAELEETCYYDHLGIKWSNDWDSIQNPAVDQGLFTAQARPQGLATIVSNWKTREHFFG